jgi:transcriptional regulator with XRE-family HTH domain
MTKPKKPITLRTLRRNQRDRGILYKIIRVRLGITQAAMGDLMGCSRDSIAAREGSKRLYTARELLALKDVSGLDDVEWCELLREIAK